MLVVSIVMMVFGSLWIVTLFFEKIVSHLQSKGKYDQKPSEHTPISEGNNQPSAPTISDSASYLGLSKTKIPEGVRPTKEVTHEASMPDETHQTINQPNHQNLSPDDTGPKESEPDNRLNNSSLQANLQTSSGVGNAKGVKDVFPFSDDYKDDENGNDEPEQNEDGDNGVDEVDEAMDNDDEGDDEFVVPSTMASQLVLYGQGRHEADEAEDILLDIEPGGIESYPLEELSDTPPPSFPLGVYQRRIITVRTAALDIAHSIRVRKRRKESIYLIDQFLQVIKHYEMIGDRNVAKLVDAVALSQVEDEEDDMALFLRLQRQTSSGVEEAEHELVA